MEQSFWQSCWTLGQIGFHRENVNPNLVRHVDVWLSPNGSVPGSQALTQQRVLVPLAGKTVDVTWLAAQGAAVVAAEFVEQAVRSYFVEANLAPTEQQLDVGLRFSASLADKHTWDTSGLDGLVTPAGSIEFWVADFFALKPEHVGPLTAVYDRAALVAINPERQRAYAAQLAKLMPQGARLLLVSFSHDSASGPPFSVPRDQVERLLSPWFELTLLADDDISEREPRYQERGMNNIREHVWLGVRNAT